MKMTHHLLVGMITIGLGFSGTLNPAQARDDGRAIAMGYGLPGKNYVDGRGLQYTQELYNQFIKAGCEAYLITYKWRQTYETPAQTRTWTLVVYRDAEDRYWAMEPRSTQPTWVPGDNPQQWIARMHPSLVFSVVSTRTEPKFAGQYADLTRKPAAVALQLQPSSQMPN